MPSSRRGDALARAALDLGYVTKPQIEEARRLQLEASETSGATRSLLDVLVERGHLTPDRARLVEQMGEDPTGRKGPPSSAKNKARRATTGQQRRVRHGPTGFHQRPAGGLTGADKLRILVGFLSGAIGLAVIVYALTRGGPAPDRTRARRSTPPPAPPPRVSIPREGAPAKAKPDDEAAKAAREVGPGPEPGSASPPKAAPRPKVKPPAGGGPRSGKRPKGVPKHAVSYEGHWYALYPKAVTWKDAKLECEKLGGHLVTIGSKGENTFVMDMCIKRKMNTWIGFTDERQEGTFVWITGEKVSYTAWSNGEPNNWGKGEHYAASWRGKTWNDFPAHFRTGFVCEWE